MRFTLTVADPQVGYRSDVVVDADPATATRLVIDALVEHTRGSGALPSPGHPAGPGDGTGMGAIISLASRRPQPSSGRHRHAAADPAEGDSSGWDGAGMPAYVLGRALDPGAELSRSGMREGCVVSLGDPSGCLPAEPQGVLDVRVTAGHGTGLVHRLAPGEWQLGSGRQATVRLPDPALPAVALTLVVRADGGCRLAPVPGLDAIGPAAADPAISIDGTPVTAELEWLPAQILRLPGCDLQADPVTPADAALQPSEDGVRLDYNRPPRLLPPLRQTVFRLPRRPQPPARRAFPLLMMVAPLLLAIGGVLLFKMWYYLLIGVFSPITAVGSYLSDRRSGKRSHRQATAEYRERKAAVEAAARAALVEEAAARRAAAPDAGELLLVTTGPRARLWERRRSDVDHLLVRFGVGDLPSDVRIDDPDAEQDHDRQVAWTAAGVPVTVALGEAGVLGIAGRGDLPRRLAGWAVAQLAVLQSPRDIRMVVLTDGGDAQPWEWARWLPHLRTSDDPDAPVSIGADPETVARRLGELGAVLAARKRAAADARQAAMTFRDPDLVVVLDGARRLRSMPGVVPLLADGPALGIRAICLDTDERLLPEECTAVVSETLDGLRVRRQRADVVEGVRADLVPDGWCERVARSLAPIRDVGDSGEVGLPAGVRLLDLLDLDPPRADRIAARWLAGGRTTRALVGQGLDGPLAIDLRTDGPHALLAGTTGAGKSELLQTLVASLAAANRPDAITFVLVDYKGGSAFKDCVRLPHTVGMVTDLDDHLVGRALESLSAELRRREHLLAAAGAKDLEDYTELSDRPGGPQPLPRLVIVIDEFASLARELPDFVTGLVNIAQRGRSLGIHLVLATQRPSGVVSPEIRANTNLRIALRVTDAGESSDVIEAPDAARISRGTPGRAYARLGHATLVAFQSARVGGRRPGSARTGLPAPWVRELARSELGAPLPAPRAVAIEESDDTDLAALVEALGETARSLRLPAQPSPWLPALPERLTLEAALALDGAGEPELPVGGRARVAVPPLAFGAVDLPARQRQEAARYDLAGAGHLSVIGAPRSGRSTALRAIAGAVARDVDPRDVHLYGVDCGNNALLPLLGLPHTGAVVTRDQPGRLARLTDRLLAEIVRRQRLLTEQGFADLREQRAAAPPDQRLPYLLVLLDRWEGFIAAFDAYDGGRLVDQWMQILAEGAGAGVKVVLSCDRTGLVGRLSTTIDDKLVLRLADPADYASIGLPARQVPAQLPPGRGFRSEGVQEVQVTLLADDPSGPAQVAALQALGRRAGERAGRIPRELQPFRVDPLPARITLDEALGLAEQPLPVTALPIGVGGDVLSLCALDVIEHGPGILVAGPRRSGRSTALRVVLTAALRRGWRAVVLTARVSPLRDLTPDPAVSAGLLTCLPAEAPREEVTAAVRGLAPGAAAPSLLVLDDLELIGADGWLPDLITEHLGLIRDTGSAVIAAGTLDELSGVYRGPVVALKKSRSGLLLAPQQPNDGDLFGLRLPRTATGGATAAGRGVLVRAGDWQPVQVPWPG